MGEWVSVKDRLPDTVIIVLTCTSGGIVDTAWRTEMSDPPGAWDSFSGRRGFNLDDITHWMPLPEPPHPENPTWQEWLIEQGVIKENPNGVGSFFPKLFERIDEETAKKLGIQPKEPT